MMSETESDRYARNAEAGNLLAAAADAIAKASAADHRRRGLVFLPTEGLEWCRARFFRAGADAVNWIAGLANEGFALHNWEFIGDNPHPGFACDAALASDKDLFVAIRFLEPASEEPDGRPRCFIYLAGQQELIDSTLAASADY